MAGKDVIMTEDMSSVDVENVLSHAINCYDGYILTPLQAFEILLKVLKTFSDIPKDDLNDVSNAGYRRLELAFERLACEKNPDGENLTKKEVELILLRVAKDIGYRSLLKGFYAGRTDGGKCINEAQVFLEGFHAHKELKPEADTTQLLKGCGLGSNSALHFLLDLSRKITKQELQVLPSKLDGYSDRYMTSSEFEALVNVPFPGKLDAFLEGTFCMSSVLNIGLVLQYEMILPKVPAAVASTFKPISLFPAWCVHHQGDRDVAASALRGLGLSIMLCRELVFAPLENGFRRCLRSTEEPVVLAMNPKAQFEDDLVKAALFTLKHLETIHLSIAKQIENTFDRVKQVETLWKPDTANKPHEAVRENLKSRYEDSMKYFCRILAYLAELSARRDSFHFILEARKSMGTIYVDLPKALERCEVLHKTAGVNEKSQRGRGSGLEFDAAVSMASIYAELERWTTRTLGCGPFGVSLECLTLSGSGEGFDVWLGKRFPVHKDPRTMPFSDSQSA